MCSQKAKKLNHDNIGNGNYLHYNNELDKKQPEKVESCGQILAQAKVAEGQITPSSK